MDKQETVFVGMSGGVDSSVAAYLLKKEGYNVVGVFIKVWQPPFLRCHWEDERLDAMRAAAALDIPFLTCDAEEAYKRDVADYFIREYERGNTPNPDVMCNRYVKFGAFHAFAKANGADHIATGHYAKVSVTGEEVSLLCGVDPKKDQSYFLWNAPLEALKDTLFPLGGLTKEKVRQIAKSAGLPNAQKRDSQGICFLGAVDIPEFLGHYLTLEAGEVIDAEGVVIGTHQGAILYTLGQRHGFTLTHEGSETMPQYVVARDLTHNTITVAGKKPEQGEGSAQMLLRDTQIFRPVTARDRLEAQFRYHGPRVSVVVAGVSDTEVKFTLEGVAETPAPGQSAVLFDGNRIVLGGIIS